MTASDHEKHRRHVTMRAVLQLWADRHGLQLVRLKRRPICRRREESSGQDASDDHLNTFIESLADSYDLRAVDWDYGEELRALYAGSAHMFGLTEILTGLQFLLQGVIEALLLEDRKVFLHQQAGLDCQLWEIFDEELSPRNKLLLVHKS
jgi:hypothetical protein